MDRLARLVATFFGTGFFPVAPATFASAIVAGILLWWGAHPVAEMCIIVGLLPISIVSAHVAEKSLGHDAHPIVIDEVVGQMIALWNLPRSWPWVLAGFLLFRVFDIWKPLGAREAQRLPGGWGIVVDDVMAGLYAWVLLELAQRFLMRGHA
jgi:phosphatidylglycerophosphatase A